jgi:aldehyde dehydrogenase (NAD+)
MVKDIEHAADNLEPKDSVFVGGTWQRGGSRRLTTVVDPSTEEAIGAYYDASRDDVDSAVRNSRAALCSGEWSNSRLSERVEILKKLALLVDAHHSDLASHVVSELGVPVARVGPHVLGVVDFIRRTIDVAERYPFEQVRSDGQNDVLVTHEPVGVVAGIMPFNAPFLTPVIGIAPALLARCSVVWKPDAQVALSAFAFAELCRAAGLPDGVLNVVAGGPEVGRTLVRHDGVDKVTFTGSSSAGRDIAAACGAAMKRVTLELGGKSAAIVLDDADLAKAISAVVQGSLTNNGQTCYAVRRLLVPKAMHDSVVDAVADQFRRVRVGDAHDSDSDMGPLASTHHLDRVLEYIDVGCKEGARLVTGGRTPKDCDRGWFVEPTLFDRVENHMRVAQEEIFGPVLVVETYDDEGHALGIANDSPYGLSGCVFTSDAARGLDVARKVRTGTFSVNTFGVSVDAPFGGFKQSGVGRKYAVEGFGQYLEPKSILYPREG